MSDNDFDLLIMLDSPLLDGMAPELTPYRKRVIEAGTVKEGCSACEERKRIERLTHLQIEIANFVEANPALKSLVPQLIASAKQVFHDRSSSI
jgi:hypothetical protein